MRAALLDGKADGTFVVTKQQQPWAPDGNGYVLSVRYQGRPTHHKLRVGEGGQSFLIQKGRQTAVDASSIAEVVAHLRRKHAYWPVPLGEHVSVSTLGAPAASRAATVAASGEAPWLHKKMKSNSVAAGACG